MAKATTTSMLIRGVAKHKDGFASSFPRAYGGDIGLLGLGLTLGTKIAATTAAVDCISSSRWPTKRRVQLMGIHPRCRGVSGAPNHRGG